MTMPRVIIPAKAPVVLAVKTSGPTPRVIVQTARPVLSIPASGQRGPSGPKGDKGDSGSTADPGDLTLIFDNGLI